MAFSTTYYAALIGILAQVLPWFDIQIDVGALQVTVDTLITIAAGIWVMYRRFSQGDIGLGGIKK